MAEERVHLSEVAEGGLSSVVVVMHLRPEHGHRSLAEHSIVRIVAVAEPSIP